MLFYCFFFFFNDTATTEIYTLSLHDALPISAPARRSSGSALAVTLSRLGEARLVGRWLVLVFRNLDERAHLRSEEHTSELQSQSNLVCRLLLEKKKKKKLTNTCLHHIMHRLI